MQVGPVAESFKSQNSRYARDNVVGPDVDKVIKRVSKHLGKEEVRLCRQKSW